MRHQLAALLAITTALSTAPVLAQEFGDYAYDSIRALVFDYPGRYTGSEKFTQASDYMTDRLAFGGGTVTRQEFTSSWGPSHNLLREMEGENGKFIVVGAHFDTAGTFDDLQGVDDNASGAALLTELAAHMSGMDLETGLVFNAFGAEEIGLQGSRYYVENLTPEQQQNIAGMINIDSLITGDHKYAHAGTNYLTNAELKSFWTRIHSIADELDIDLRSNPGNNPHYPVDTGCCSDAAPFEALDIPILWMEATNWDLGDLDGYTQTDNPAIPGGATWHTPELDRWDVLTAAFGEERIPERLHDYSLLLTRLLVEETGADLIASSRNAGMAASQMADVVAMQQDDLSAFSLQSARARLAMPGQIGRFTPNVTVEGLARPGGNSDLGTDGGSALSAHAGGFWQMSEELSFGGALSYRHSGNDLSDGGEVSAKSFSAGLDAAWKRGASWAVAAVSYGKADLSGDRDFIMTSGLGAEILRRNFDYDTDAYMLGASIHAGHDFGTSEGLSYGPVIGLDYASTRIAGFTESGNDRRAVSYDEMDFESLELQLGGQVGQRIDMGGRAVRLSAHAAYVRELADGRPDSVTVTDSTGTARKVGVTGADDSFGRIGVSAEMELSPQAVGWISVDGRVGHDAGSQTAVGAGVSMRF
ncbi:autotransporter domain-containing protein [Paracoccus caeni]|uniref:Autotransporter domain-containing protein n=1 Tax=Paracoccus caeni TaxID=657651 RepID=A0A934W026_9RHOB|nr:autotransporter domain-containing protein [Paracoccus caeni]MBK4217637.1 autotransporter domain-containing protein [Paracoccus caeni]